MRGVYFILASLILLAVGTTLVTPFPFDWKTEKIVIADTRGSPLIQITHNGTQYEITPGFECPNNYRCNLQVVIEAMTCVRNISSPAPDYIKFYMYDNDGVVNVTDECGNIDSSTFHENTIIGRGLNSSKVLIQPVGQRWEESDFKASVFVRVDLQPEAGAKEIKINRILSNFELNFVDDAQYVVTVADFNNDDRNDELFPPASWKRVVRVSIQDMKCNAGSAQKLQIDASNAIGIPSRATTLCQNVDSDQVTITILNPGETLTISAIGDEWKTGSGSALVVFTTQMTSEDVADCPSNYFNCVRNGCRDSTTSKSVCIPLDLTCNKRHNCLDTCKMDESEDVCVHKPSTCPENEFGEQLRTEVHKIGTWFVGLILVLVMLIGLLAFHVGLTSKQSKSLKAIIITKLNEISSRSLSGLPSYQQLVHNEKQALS